MGNKTARLPHGLTLVGALAAITLAGCGGSEDNEASADEPTTSVVTTTTSSTTTTRTPRPTPTTPKLGDVLLECFNTDDGSTLTVRVTRESADFTSAWAAANGGRCESEEIRPTTDLEQKAYEVSGYRSNDVSTLYGICARVDPDDVVLQEDFAMNDVQASEVKGALTLCPDHPLRAEYTAAIEAGAAAQEQIDSGARVYGGTHEVPDEMQRGTFVAKDVSDCYWETRDSNGGIIDNDFIVAAPQVRITLSDNVVVFTTEGCGEWVKEG